MSGRGKVAVGFCWGQTTITPQWRRSYTFALARDMAQGHRIVGEFDHEASAGHLDTARCEIVRWFLAHPSAPEWLWMMDTDATFDDETLERLVATADAEKRPIVGALAFGVRPAKDAGGREVRNSVGATAPELFPTIYVPGDKGAEIVWDYPTDQVVRCFSTGAHCLLIHRSVLADPRWTEDGHPLPWFRKAYGGSGEVSEDQFFCIKAGTLGYPTHVDTSIKTGHVKVFIADEDLYLAQRATVEEPVSPATEPVAVIVPVLNRPQNAAPFMASLWATTRLATVYAVCSEEADAEAWEKAGATVVRTDRISFPCKVNDAYPHTSEPWVFLVGDDVQFHDGWLDHAEHVARKTGARVVGTNDLGYEAVTTGKHATHMLLARSYIDELGASWDRPGVVCHEGYRHWYVDNEIIAAAKMRGEWMPCLRAVVEHLHPAFGKAEMDDTYRKGEFRVEHDRHLFEKRVAANMAVAA